MFAPKGVSHRFELQPVGVSARRQTSTAAEPLPDHPASPRHDPLPTRCAPVRPMPTRAIHADTRQLIRWLFRLAQILSRRPRRSSVSCIGRGSASSPRKLLWRSESALPSYADGVLAAGGATGATRRWAPSRRFPFRGRRIPTALYSPEPPVPSAIIADPRRSPTACVRFFESRALHECNGQIGLGVHARPVTALRRPPFCQPDLPSETADAGPNASYPPERAWGRPLRRRASRAPNRRVATMNCSSHCRAIFIQRFGRFQNQAFSTKNGNR